MNYIQITEWSLFQHYKKRNPPWIKLYSAILDDDDFDCLPDASKLLFFCLLIFASRRNNKIKLDLKWLQKKLPIDDVITQETLQPLIDANFIECKQDASRVLAECKQDASGMLAECKQDAIPRQRREETEERQTQSIMRVFDDLESTSKDLFDTFWSLYPKQIEQETALEAWNKQPPENHRPIIESTKEWVKYWKSEQIEQRYIKAPANFIEKGTWKTRPITGSNEKDCSQCNAPYIAGQHKFTTDNGVKTWKCSECRKAV